MKKKRKRCRTIQSPPIEKGCVQIGDTVVRRPSVFADKIDSKNAVPMHGRVVYVHPLGRFHVVEFGEGRKAVRECFMGMG